MRKKEVQIISEDGFKLYGFLYYPDNGKQFPLVFFAHQFGTTHVIWHDLAVKFLNIGYAVFLTDLRGHGLSIYQNGKENKIIFKTEYNSILDLINFFKKSWKKVGFEKIPDDISRWISFLKESEPVKKDHIILIGSSLGGISIIPVIEKHNIKAFISISPGVEEIVGKERVYRSLKHYKNRGLFLGSYNDLLNSKDVIERLISHMEKGVSVLTTKKGHGIVLLSELEEYIFTFIKHLNEEGE